MNKPRINKAATRESVQKQAKALGLQWDVHDEHDWAHIHVYLDLIAEGLIPPVCVVDRKLTDQALRDRVGDETRREYHDTVRAIAEELVKEAPDDDEEERGEYFERRIDEEADGNHYVIYTHANLATLVFSDNWLAIDEAIDEGLVELGTITSLTDVLSRAAFFALRADLRQQVDAIDPGAGDNDD